MWQLEDSDIEIVVAPYFNDLDSNRIDVRPLAGLPLLALRQPEFTGPQRLLKRVTGAAARRRARSLLLAPGDVDHRGPRQARQPRDRCSSGRRRVGRSGRRLRRA